MEEVALDLSGSGLEEIEETTETIATMMVTQVLDLPWPLELLTTEKDRRGTVRVVQP